MYIFSPLSSSKVFSKRKQVFQNENNTIYMGYEIFDLTVEIKGFFIQFMFCLGLVNIKYV